MTNREQQLVERLREATRALRTTLDQRDALERERTEPIAIIGIGCRLPGGADSPAAFWDLLAEGRDAVVPLKSRWAQLGVQPDEQLPRWAALLSGPIDEFEPAFFGIAPREARSMDPQQRLLLEVAWEALEDAGIAPLSLNQSRTGVFVAACTDDYSTLVEQQPAAERDAYCTTGSMLSILAGRLSYTLGLQGPCFTIDTACSSSLVAIHQACRSLRSRESELALAGGVNLIMSLDSTTGLSRIQALSPDGRCRTFDALANGYVRGEGCGLLVLKRLRDAQRDADRIWAVIRGSAINQDGRSTGLTAPNVLAQQALIRDALKDADVLPDAVGYVETHGTGTSLGDPIEVQALREVLGRPRPEGGRCVLGAVKTNIGHLEGAAGVAGVIKAALVLHRERIPKNLHLRTLNAHIELAGSSLVLATEAAEWPRGERPRYAGVSSFGLSGTNAHVVLEEAPLEAGRSPASARPAELLVLSGRTEAALRAQAARLLQHLQAHPEIALSELAFSLASARSALEHRLALVATTREELLPLLEGAAQWQLPAGASRGSSSSSSLGRGKLAFLFTGQGAQIPGMGRGLYETWPAFREAFDRCTALFDPTLPRPLREVMWAEAGSAEVSLLDQTGYTQPALFVLEYALSELWRSFGVKPELVAGHSIGELVAACVAGVFTLQDAVRLCAARARLMQALPEGGAMVSLSASEAEVAAAVAPHSHVVSIAAINAADQVVIAGEQAAVAQIAAGFSARGVRTRVLPVSHAFHSPQVDPILAKLREVAESITYHPPRLPLVSNVTGAPITDEICRAEYWVSHARQTVQFAAVVRALLGAGVRTFLELGPRATLLGLVPAGPDKTPRLLPSLRGTRNEAACVFEALGGLWTQGGAVDWQGVFPARGRRLPLPTYAWQRQHCWVAPPSLQSETNPFAAESGRTHRGGHPLLGEVRRLSSQPGTLLWDTTLQCERPSWITDHRLKGAVVFPGAGHLEMALAAGLEVFGAAPFLVEDLALLEVLVIPEKGAVPVQVETSQERPGRMGFQVASRQAVHKKTTFRVHSRAVLQRVDGESPRPKLDLSALRARMREAQTSSAFYTAMRAMGVELGPSFQGVRELWRGEGEALGRVLLPEAAGADAEYQFHPALLDACLQVMAGCFGEEAESTPWVPVRLGMLRLLQQPMGELYCHARTVARDATLPNQRHAELAVMDGTGALVAELCGLVAQRVEGTRRSSQDDWYLSVQWERAQFPQARLSSGRWLLLGRSGGLAASLRAALVEAGHAVALADSVPISTDAVCDLLSRCFQGQGPTAVVHLASLDEGAAWETEGPGASAQQNCESVLRTVQALISNSYRDAPRLWLLTRGAQAVSVEAPMVQQAPVLGLGRTIALEHPELRCARLDLDPERPEDERSAILAELLGEDAEEEVSHRGGQRWVSRLVRRVPASAPRERAEPAQVPTTRPVMIRKDGSYLISGGLGGLGLSVAGWLAQQGAGQLVLLSRKGVQSPEQEGAIAQLRAHGCRVVVAQGDVADPGIVASVLREVSDSGLPLRGVVHAAGVLDDGVLMKQSAERLQKVLQPKVQGAWNLHALTRQSPLDFFVMYSSVAGLLGSPGQGNYAAANSFLDALSHLRRAEGLPGLSIDWGVFGEVGLGVQQDDRAKSLERRVMRSLKPEEGLQVLSRLLGGSEAVVGVVPLNLRQWGALHQGAWASARFSALRSAAETEVQRQGDPEFLSKLREASVEARVVMLAEHVRGHVAHVLRIRSAELDADAPLTSLGLDSLMAVELRNRLQSLLGVRFELSAIWRSGNLREFSAELVRLLSAQTALTASSQAADAPVITRSAAGRPLLAPLSAGQQRLYFLDQVLELRHTYNLTLAFRLPAALDVELLRSAVERLIARHEQLRVCFVEHEGQPRQRILPWVEPPIEALSLTASEGERDAALRQLIETESKKRFDLSQAPLFRVLYIGMGQAGSALAVIWHHIATDGASMAIFFAELSASMQALRDGRHEELAAAPSYALYATRQHEWLQTAACAAQREFWKTRLKDLPALELPGDRPHPLQRTERGGLVTFRLPRETGVRIEALAKRLRSTPFAIVSAAWSALLSRYSGQHDFAIGITMAGRHEDAFRDGIGFFVNTLPLRCQLHDDPTGLEYIQRIHEEIWSALEHQELPLDEMVRVVAPDRQPGFIGSPLFRTCVSYNEHRESIDSFAGLPATALVDPVIEKVGGTSKFDLLLSVMKSPQGLAAALEFSADLFDIDTMERCTQHFVTLLTKLVEQPERRLYELPLLTEEERQRILFAWNDTLAEYPRESCLHQRFEAQVQKTPDAVALVHGDEQLSYGALNKRANALAHRLRALGVGADGLVALCVERSLEMVVAILGTLKAGGAYVPIDPDSPADRIDFMLKDTRPVALLTQRELVGRLPRASVVTLCLDDPSTFAGQPVEDPIPVSTSANLAYVIYTSGSTGRPKGVLMEHHSVNNLLQALNRRAWGPGPLRVAMLAPVFFDMSVKPLFGALLYGHTLYIVDKQIRRDGSALLSFFQRNAIAWSDCTPSILAMLVEAGLPTCQLLDLQVLLCGGEALKTALVDSVYAPGVQRKLRIINVYGPTETCVNVNANPITAQTVDTSRAVVPMGRPFENTQLYVLDDHDQPVPVGVPGELHIGGVGLARGYLNRPDLTAEKFIRNPFLVDPGARMYKTGDRVRYLPDGKLEFLGRRDHQVKIRGFRIELGEIESVLSSHPGVGSCIVLAREDTPGEKRLVAYVAPQPGHSVTAEALTAHLAKLLPDYMLPAAFVFLDALPLTRNGKVDRGVLPAPIREPDREAFVPPANPLEHALADIFKSVLRTERVGRNDDFFALGGDSLLAVRAVTQAQQAGLVLTVNQLFRAPTVAKLYAGMRGGTGAPCMMMLKEGSAPGGVILVPGAGGVFHRAHEIARALDTKTAAFGLISPALAGMKERPASVEELAAVYAEDIIKCVPQGPLALLGYSFGGAVAIEIARALRERERAVDLVILLDARPGSGEPPRELDVQTALAALRETLGIPASHIQSAENGDPLMALLSHLMPDLQDAQGLRSFLGVLFENARDADKMLAAWEPRLPPVPVHLLRVESDEDRGADYGWSQHGALASVQVLPGQHYSLLRPPYLDTTMRAVRSLLDRT